MPTETNRITITLPKRINVADAREAAARIERTLAANPASLFMVGAVAVNRDNCDIDAACCDFSTTHWVALADASLQWAATRLAAAGSRSLLECVQRARAELDFEEMKQDA